MFERDMAAYKRKLHDWWRNTQHGNIFTKQQAILGNGIFVGAAEAIGY